MIWFTADTHFGHANIIKYTGRPFSSVGEMNEEIIHRWNEVVGDDDVVYHLGDFTLGNCADARLYFTRLRGKICVLTNQWHHDRRWINYEGRYTGASMEHITLLPVMKVLELTYGPGVIVLCHYPLAIWDRKHYGAWHLHGHSHGRYQGEGFIYDVGVDNNDFYPVSLERVAEIMEGKGWHEGWRQYA